MIMVPEAVVAVIFMPGDITISGWCCFVGDMDDLDAGDAVAAFGVFWLNAG